MKYLLKNLGVKANVLKYPDVCLAVSFFGTSIWGTIAPNSLARQSPPSSQKAFE